MTGVFTWLNEYTNFFLVWHHLLYIFWTVDHLDLSLVKCFSTKKDAAINKAISLIQMVISVRNAFTPIWNNVLLKKLKVWFSRVLYGVFCYCGFVLFWFFVFMTGNIIIYFYHLLNASDIPVSALALRSSWVYLVQKGWTLLYLFNFQLFFLLSF